MGKFEAGTNWKGNANGRPRVPEIEIFRTAMDKLTKEKKIGLIEHAVRQAYDDTNVLVAVLRKVLPDLSIQKNDQAVNLQIYMDLSQRIVQVLNKTLPEKCPHCKHGLELRGQTIKELEVLSHTVGAINAH